MKTKTDDFDKYIISFLMYQSKPGDTFGLFQVPFESRVLRVMSSGVGGEWEHVSVSLENRCPNWKEMSFIKELFFEEEETVVQFHPKKSEYVNQHPFCLHLWKNTKTEIILPPSILVGIKK